MSRDVRELRALEDTCLCLDSSNEERANIVDISVYEGAKRTADIPFGSFHEVSTGRDRQNALHRPVKLQSRFARTHQKRGNRHLTRH